MEKTDFLKNFPEELQEKAEIILENMEFLKGHLEELKKLDFIRVHPTDPSKQKTTAAAKQYHDFLQSYNNLNTLLLKMMNFEKGESEDEMDINDKMDLLNEYIESRNRVRRKPQ